MSAVVNLFSLVAGVVGVLVAARGTNELETTLNKTPGKDYIIGALAWIDRSVFRAGHITPGHATDQKDP